MEPIVDAGHVPVISAMGNLAAVLKDLVVDMDPFWAKMRGMKPWLEPGSRRSARRRTSSRGAGGGHPQGVALHRCSCCAPSQLDGVRSGVPRPAALAKGMRFVGDPRDAEDGRAARPTAGEHGIWDCTVAATLHAQRCPRVSTLATAIAKLRRRGDAARRRPRHGRRNTRSGRHLRQDDGCCARPSVLRRRRASSPRSSR